MALLRGLSGKRKFAIIGAVAAVSLVCVIPLFAWENGRMTGGGSVLGTNAQGQTIRVTHGFELHCGTTDTSTTPMRGPNTLEINWEGGNNFHLTNLTSISCYDDEANPAPHGKQPQLFDVYNACGDGTVNGEPGYHACWVFTDHGEPGNNDTAWYFISGQKIVLDVRPATNLISGNHQAHKEN